MANLGIAHVRQYLCKLTAGQTGDPWPDQQLLERFLANREDNAFTALVQRHGAMVYGVCRRVLHRTQDAEDAFQATFLVLARKAASIRKGESLGSWLHGVALRVAHKARVEAVRRKRREHQHMVPIPEEESDALTWGELRMVLDEELARLRADWRSPLILCYLEGRTQDEAARQLGWSKSTFRRRLERGRRLLQSRLTNRGITVSAALAAPLLFDSAVSGVCTKALLAATVQAALSLGMGKSMEAESLSRPATLAKGVLESTLLAKGKLALALLTLGLLVGAGAGLYQAEVEKNREGQHTESPFPSQPGNDLKTRPAPQGHVDQFGDPLPAQALARLGTIRFQHGATVQTIAFAPDGRSLATGGYDGTIHIWETATGKELLHFENELFPDTIGVGYVASLMFAPDGRRLAGARPNHPPCLWDVSTGKKLREYGGEQRRALCLAFSPDGKSLAFCGTGNDPGIWLVDVETGRVQHHFPGPEGIAAQVTFSPGGTLLATVHGLTVYLWDLASGQNRKLPGLENQTTGHNDITFWADGKTLAVVSRDRKFVQLVDVATGNAVRTITLAAQLSRDPKRDPTLFTPDGKNLISADADGFVRFWDMATGTHTRQFRAHSERLVALGLSRDGRTLATACNAYGQYAVRVWETDTLKPLSHYPGPEKQTAYLAFSPDNRLVASASWEGAVQVWEALSGKLLQKWKVFGPVGFASDGHTVICCGFEDSKIRFLDSSTGKETRQFQANSSGIRSASLSRDRKTLATASHDEFLRLWDLASGRQLQDFGGKQNGLTFRLVLSPDARFLGSIHHDKVLRLWETTTGKLVREHPLPGRYGGVAFSPDSRLLATSGQSDFVREGIIRLFDVAKGQEIRQMRGYGDPFDSIAFSPDGRTLSWGGQNRKNLFLWEVATGQLRQKLVGHQGDLTCVAFSPDGRMMASGSSDASVLIWDASGHLQRQHSAGIQLSTSQLDQLWIDLAEPNAAKAYQALSKLRASPRDAIPFLEIQLKSVPRADANQIAEAIRDLDSPQFRVRARATEMLEKLGEAAEPVLRQVLAGKPSLEVRQRITQLLERMEGPELWRRSRALEVLEQIGDSESRRVLSMLAHGAPGASLTTEAQAALERSGH